MKKDNIMTLLCKQTFLAICVLMYSCTSIASTPSDNDTAQSVTDGVRAYLSDIVAQKTANQNHISNIELNIAPIHRGLKLQPCSKPLSFEVSGHTRLPGRVAVKVSCRSDIFWSLFVSASVTWHQRVVMAQHSLFRSQEIGPNDIYTANLKMNRAESNYLSAPEEVIGKVVKRQLSANKPIDPRYLQQANTINKGDSIVLFAKSGSIAVRSSGTALASGMAGQQIKVKNDISKRIVKARIVKRGHAEVVM